MLADISNKFLKFKNLIFIYSYKSGKIEYEYFS